MQHLLVGFLKLPVTKGNWSILHAYDVIKKAGPIENKN